MTVAGSEENWVWVGQTQTSPQSERTACIHGRRKSGKNTDQWVCGSCGLGILGNRPIVGTRCPHKKCRMVVCASRYKEEPDG